ncbi:MAG: MFS transporter [Phycisphaerae bacterium]
MVDAFRSSDVPLLSRANYRAEWTHTLGWGVFAGMVEGNTSSIVVAKTFHADPLLVTVVWTTPMLANVLSVFWGALIRGKRRIPMFVMLATLALLAFMSIGLTPVDGSAWAGWLFATQIGVARIFVAAIVNVRTSMWTQNYPAAVRGRITGKLQGLRFTMTLVAAAAVSLLFNADPAHYRWAYPLVGFVGLLSLWPLRRVRVRGERSELRRHAASVEGGANAHGMLANLREAAQILRTDKKFARYCSAQHMLGSANFMVDPVLAVVITTQLKFGYFESGLLLDILPNIVLLMCVPLWARHFDKHGVLRFRVTNTMYWMASTLTAALALLCIALGGVTAAWVGVPMLVFSRLINGVGRAGGSIAWNLGHLHFAPPHAADLYMGIHVALTGLRGLIMPFVAVFLFTHVGWWSLMLATTFNFIAMLMFWRLARDYDDRSAEPAAPRLPSEVASDES